jgi:hypothetical protein
MKTKVIMVVMTIIIKMKNMNNLVILKKDKKKELDAYKMCLECNQKTRLRTSVL